MEKVSAEGWQFASRRKKKEGTKTTTGRHFQTGQVIWNSSETGQKTEECIKERESITRPHLIMEWSRPSTQHRISACQFCCHINHLGSGQTKYENTECRQIRAVLNPTEQIFLFLDGRRWEEGSGSVCKVTLAFGAPLPHNSLNAFSFLGCY